MVSGGKMPMIGPTGRGAAILVVDDEPAIRQLVAEMLRLDGHEVETASNGALAFDKLQERAYDVILSDLRMPELDGEGLYRAVTRLDPVLGRRFIFVTGSSLDPERRRVLEGLGVPILDKPFRLDEIQRVVRQALGAV